MVSNLDKKALYAKKKFTKNVTKNTAVIFAGKTFEFFLPMLAMALKFTQKLRSIMSVTRTNFG